MTCKTDKTHQCKSCDRNLKSLENIVACYIEKHRRRAEEELHSYAKKTSFQEVVSMAATAKGPWNGIHDHQKRVGGLKLSEFTEHLSGILSELKQSTSFEELYNAIEVRKITGVGELTVYDTALRIGAYLKIEPENVYLHRGAKEGAENLSRYLRGRKSISVDELPPAFHKLRPREIEDCLCICKKAFQNIRR